MARERKLINDREQGRERARERYGYEDAYTGDGVRVGNEQKRVTARLMAAQGMSIRAIAEALGVGKSTIDRWLAE